MKHFPDFMKNPANAIDSASQSKGIAGYVFDGADRSQMAFWECPQAGVSLEHTHGYDEYMLVVEGPYTLIIGGKRIPVTAGKEYLIPGGVSHAGEWSAGTRTIHTFGGPRAKRKE
ncbi:MAG: cupin domain-containing protein [Dehalococcoidia bacterium]